MSRGGGEGKGGQSEWVKVPGSSRGNGESNVNETGRID